MPKKRVLASYIHPEGVLIPPFGGLQAHNRLGGTGRCQPLLDKLIFN